MHESMILSILPSRSLILYFFFTIRQVPKIFYEDNPEGGVEMGKREGEKTLES